MRVLRPRRRGGTAAVRHKAHHPAAAAPGFKAAPRVRAAPSVVGSAPADPPPAIRSAAGVLRCALVALAPLQRAGVLRGVRRIPLPCPLRGFGGGRLQPRGRRRRCRLFLRPAPGACCARAAPACFFRFRSAAPFFGGALRCGVLPCALPAPAAPAGGSGRAPGCAAGFAPTAFGGGSPALRAAFSPCLACDLPLYRRVKPKPSALRGLDSGGIAG